MDNNKKNNEDNDKIDPNGAEKYRVQGEKHTVSDRGGHMDIGTGTGMKWDGSQRVYSDYAGLLELDSIVDFVGKRNH